MKPLMELLTKALSYLYLFFLEHNREGCLCCRACSRCHSAELTLLQKNVSKCFKVKNRIFEFKFSYFASIKVFICSCIYLFLENNKMKHLVKHSSRRNTMVTNAQLSSFLTKQQSHRRKHTKVKRHSIRTFNIYLLKHSFFKVKNLFCFRFQL